MKKSWEMDILKILGLVSLSQKPTTTTEICMYVSKRARLHFLKEQEGFV